MGQRFQTGQCPAGDKANDDTQIFQVEDCLEDRRTNSIICGRQGAVHISHQEFRLAYQCRCDLLVG